MTFVIVFGLEGPPKKQKFVLFKTQIFKLFSNFLKNFKQKTKHLDCVNVFIY